MTEKARTPLMQQYYDIKDKNPDIVVFFRLGDFYEMFDQDAKEASSILGVALTQRGGTPMCGIPYHAAGAYVHKMIKAGKKVGICEQVGAATGTGKNKLFERKIVRIITPGTVLEDNMLDSYNSNYIACVITDKKTWALAAADVSTGEFWVTQKTGDDNFAALQAAIAALQPSEILLDRFAEESVEENIPPNILITRTHKNAGESIPEAWAGAGAWQDKKQALSAALTLTDYISVNDAGFKDMFIPVYKELKDYLNLDENAIRSLELVYSQNGVKKGSLWHTLDFTNTPMGSRALKSWLLNPLLDINAIKERHDTVENLKDNEAARAELKAFLKENSDIERIMSRIANGSASPRDMAGLKKSLWHVEELKAWLAKYSHLVPKVTAKISPVLNTIDAVAEVLYKAVEDAPPLKLSDGGVIKAGYNAELDELRELKKNSSGLLSGLAQRERESTGIPSLKIGFNSVFGYYIEVTNTHIAKVPYNYVRKQTLANAERFITEELKNLEDKILNAEDKITKLETYIFEEIRKYLSSNLETLRAYSSAVAALDVFLSLADAAEAYRLTRPLITENGALKAEGVRHLLVEEALPAGAFVPNDINLDQSTQISVITGPNMGGKSVYLKQTALLVIMAQAGSFVPADIAEVSVTDRIMTRIGAQDALSRGESTFMVEMRETAHILQAASARTLVLLDEVGRGTSTYDGVAIARAIIEFLYNPESGPKVLFATHYFELTDLPEKYPAVKNFHVEVQEYKDNNGHPKLAFLYKIKEGPADRSYGIHVAELAGLPKSCTLRARKVLKDFETKKNLSITKKESGPADLFSSPIVEEIRMTDPDKLTPIEALQLITQWKKRIDE
ncbi:DNA mismatch repair protein MutS [Parelusimicrobium proximum]|uniref:DNA mismatch repair protein MutS n=1 Tax=Parelusimicrobium proximum TaxID=3228953 RepID=UPI003D184C4B